MIFSIHQLATPPLLTFAYIIRMGMTSSKRGLTLLLFSNCGIQCSTPQASRNTPRNTRSLHSQARVKVETIRYSGLFFEGLHMEI